MPQGLDIHPRLIANFSSMARKLRSEKERKAAKIQKSVSSRKEGRKAE
jgi:hypothetical protein